MHKHGEWDEKRRVFLRQWRKRTRRIHFSLPGGIRQVSNLTVQHGADAGQNVCVQPGDITTAVVVDLIALHFYPVTELVLADNIAEMGDWGSFPAFP